MLSSFRYLHNSSPYLSNQKEAINIEKKYIPHEVLLYIDILLSCCVVIISFLFWFVILSDYIIEFKITIFSVFSYKYETKGSFQFHLNPSNSSIHSLGHLQCKNKIHARFDSLQQEKNYSSCSLRSVGIN